MCYGVTVSVHYSDLLEIVLPQNAKFFKKWYIVTQETDTETLEVIRKFSFENVEVLFFDFTKEAVFNKGGGVNMALQQIPSDERVLLLDSDIYIDDSFLNFNKVDLERDTLYSFVRYDYYTYQHFIEDKEDHIYPLNFMGFFQLFVNDKKYYYQDSNNCRECDSSFRHLFSSFILIDGKIVKHLGRDNVNHFGRTNREDFIFDKDPLYRSLSSS